METAQKNIQDAEREFERIRREITAFKARMLSIYREHLSLIDVLPEEPAEEPEAPAEPEAKAVSTPVPAEPELIPQEPAAEEPAFEPVEEPAAEPAEPDARGVVLDLPILKDEDAETMETAEEVSAEQPAESRFGDLKFGDDYDISKDTDDEPGFFRRRK